MKDQNLRLNSNDENSFNIEEYNTLLEIKDKLNHVTTELIEEFRNKTKKLEDITDSLHKVSVELKSSIKPVAYEIVKNVKQELIQDLDDRMKDCQNNINKIYDMNQSILHKINVPKSNLLKRGILIAGGYMLVIMLGICIIYYTVARNEQNERAAEAIEIEKDYRYER